MIAAILRAWWKPIIGAAAAVVVVVCIIVAWNVHGSRQYDAGYAMAQADQKAAEDKAKAQREQEKALNEIEAQQRIDQARNDALDAADRAGRLQQQIVAIRKQLGQYNATVGAGPSAADTGVLLADVLAQSLERNRQLAEYADRAAEAGRVCERQYDSLMR
ncbi:DUF2514 domain-containing protein [Superficieibacter electus]|uniref:DUF2514 domain-containing protein n=1 Tax=Superficieibacter electus TaxID=2022662 RepID=A0A2P5GJX6_9ENTR|nr:DUF2514 domain-containing protein [Superficieibacter electus]POP42164.1 DUF2514 domain-containing protein [Superficieibacter electus]POP44471.1 DUF2514 domain-containing protein [Superficieibacter electus]